MKKQITLALALLTFASVAQYNNTYDVNANSEKLTPAFVITNKKAESITVSYASDGGSPAQNYFILTKHDAFGNTIYNNRIDPYFGPNDGFTNVEALIQTDNEDVLVSGYYYDDANMIEQPFLLKVDVNGNFQWARIYYVNKKPIVRSAINKISLCRVWDDPKENYFILASGDSDINPGSDVANNVIKVDIDGNLLWSKKYYDTNPGTFLITREYPGDIEFSKDDKLYMITGYRQDATSFSGSRVMYYFAIDNNGNVVTKFLTLESKSIPIDQDMVYNAEKHLFATVFTHNKSGYVEGMSSQIGFISVDASLNIYFPRYLWHKEADTHNGRSISLVGQHDYLLCAGIYDNTSVFAHNPAWLKVDIQGDPISALLRYNIKDDVYFGHHATTYNPDSGEEEYVLVNEHKTDLRMIRTDVNGKACGVEKFEPYVKYYEPKQQTYKYDYKEQGDVKEYKVHEKIFKPDYRKCDGDGSSYRATGIAQIGAGQNNILIYPTAVQAGNAYITIENNQGANVKLEVRNIAGQLILSETSLSSGKHEVKIGNDLPAGMYLVKTSGDNGSSTTTKILVTE